MLIKCKFSDTGQEVIIQVLYQRFLFEEIFVLNGV